MQAEHVAGQLPSGKHFRFSQGFHYLSLLALPGQAESRKSMSRLGFQLSPVCDFCTRIIPAYDTPTGHSQIRIKQGGKKMMLDKERKAIGPFVMKEMLLFSGALALAFSIGASVPDNMSIGSFPISLVAATCVYGIAMVYARATRMGRLQNQ